ncbi:MAG: 1 protein [Chloroflexi bacterium]|nr:1 protein [Chloroflexota bacterium]
MTMKTVSKVTISLPSELLETAEREQEANGQTRSEFFRRLLEEHILQARERELAEQYRRGYLEFPETEEEIEQTRAMQKLIEWGPWE